MHRGELLCLMTTLVVSSTVESHFCGQEFVEAEGIELEEGTKDDPPLGKFEEQISKYKGIEKEIQALPTSANIGWIKV